MIAERTNSSTIRLESLTHDAGQQIDAVWRAALGELQLQMPRATFDTWLKGTSVITYEPPNRVGSESAAQDRDDAGLLVIGTQNAFAKDWLENRLADKIKQTVDGILGQPVKIKFQVHARPKAEQPAIELLQGFRERPASPTPRTDTLTTPPDGNNKVNGYSSIQSHLNPRYTFDNFIAGDGNRLAHAAALAVAEHPAERYNPLFIYGGVGLGKTHLLHAIGHVPASSGFRVRVVSSEEFTNDLISAIRTQTTEAFREKYRELDVLLIDDIQFIAGKERIQEELFHTFNTLHGANKQIVLTSDRHPKGLTTLEERLRSRFEWGLTVDIQPPDLETRIAILQSKAEQQGVPVPMAVLELIARQIDSNIRELEGALNRVVMYAQCMHCPVSMETASQALADLLASKPEPPAVPVILDIIAHHYNITVNELTGKSRSRRVAVPRQIAMYILREEAGLSFPQIGQELGGRDHSTVMHGYEKIAELAARDDTLRRNLMAIREAMYR